MIYSSVRSQLGARKALLVIKVLVQKFLNQQITVLVCFRDYQNFFGNVNHNKLKLKTFQESEAIFQEVLEDGQVD